METTRQQHTTMPAISMPQASESSCPPAGASATPAHLDGLLLQAKLAVDLKGLLKQLVAATATGFNTSCE